MASKCGSVGHRGRGRRDFLIATASLGAAILLPGTARAAEIRMLAGAVKVNGRPAKRATRVRLGDVIETAAGAKVSFVIGEDAFLMREQSRVALERSASAKAAVITGLRVLTGGLLAVFGKGAKRIETPTATAGIRGTGVYIEASATETYFCTCYGEVDLRQKGGSGHRLVVSGYHTPTMIYAQMVDGKVMAAAEVKNHTDEELIALEKLVGRTSPVTKRLEKLQGGGETTTKPQAEAPKAQPAEPAQPQPAAEAPKPQAAPEPAPQQPAPPAKPQPQAATATPEAPPQPAPKPTPPPQSEPSNLEWRLPPPRLN